MNSGRVESKMPHKTNSIKEIAQENAKQVALRLTALVGIIATLSSVLAYVALTSSRLNEALENQRRNFSYWLQVGDSFQIERALKNLNDANPVIHYSIISKNGFSWALRSDSHKSLSLDFSRRDIKLLGSDGNELGHLFISQRTPFEFLVFLIFSIFLIAPFFYAITRKYFNSFGEQLTFPMINLGKDITKSNSLESLKVLKNKNVDILEVNILNQLLSDLAIRLENQQEKLQRAELALIKEDIANQVAHDIRSPVSALQLIISNAQFDREHKAVATESLQRINEIAENLLSQRKVSRTQQSPVDLYKLSKIICAEKELIYSDSNTSLHLDGVSCFSIVQPEEYKRIVSNILNNSLEAVGRNGAIKISHYIENDLAYITIEDNGRGIPKEELPLLMNKGATFGKTNGNGLGLYYAKKTLEKYSGSLYIDSTVGVGTKVTITLPSQVTIDSRSNIITDVLIEDDPLIRKLWHYEAKAYGRELASFENARAFLSKINSIPKNAFIYIDSNLKDSTKGEEIAEKLSNFGYTNLFMASGYNPERFKGLDFLSGVVGKTPPWTQLN